jgi:hypothetical protein
MQRRSRASSSTKCVAACYVHAVYPPFKSFYRLCISFAAWRRRRQRVREAICSQSKRFACSAAFLTYEYAGPVFVYSTACRGRILPAPARCSERSGSEGALYQRRNRKFRRKSGARASCLRNRRSQPEHWQAIGWGEGLNDVHVASSMYSCGNTCSRMSNALVYAND